MNGVIHRNIFLGASFGRGNIVMVVCLLLCVYFSYHLLQGNRSVLCLLQTERAIAKKTAELSQLRGDREKLEVRVQMMRPGTVDRDFMEERIQIVLGYATPHDLILHFR